MSGELLDVEMKVGGARAAEPIDENDLVEIVVHRLHDHTAAERFEPASPIVAYGVELLADGASCEEGHHDIVGPDAIALNDIVDQDGTIVFIAVEDADVGVDAHTDEFALHLAIEEAVGIVEEGIGGV